jgi:sarcosine oxidase subunit alpha
MTVRPHRLPLDHAGGRLGRMVDRARPVGFTFDGLAYSGFAGDTLSSALLANGVRLMGRSFKYHRPRSCFTAGAEEPNAIVTVGSGVRMTPNERATTVEIHDGMVARSQNRWPSLGFDVGRVNDGFGRLIPAGFQHKTFMWPASAWPVYERLIRRAAGNGPAPRGADPDRYEHVNVGCDVLVAGAGVAGIAAALAAVESGARVIIADHAPRFGGMSDLYDATIDGRTAVDWIGARVAELAATEHAHLLLRTTVAGRYDHNFVVMDERLGRPNAPRERLWKVRARELVVATGAVERSLCFVDNDRPGVMLGSAIRAYAWRYGVVPGDAAVVLANNDDGYRTGLMLDELGLEVACIADVRGAPRGELVEAARTRGIEIAPGHAVAKVEAGFGGNQIRAVHIADLAGAGGGGGAGRRVPCDFIAVSGGWDPQAHLTAQAGGRLVWDDAIRSMKPGAMDEHVHAAGAANGTFSFEGCLNEGYAAGERAAWAALGRAAPQAMRRPARISERREGMGDAFDPAPPVGGPRAAARQFVDLAADVTAADLELAVREGYDGVELVKRYTALGMAWDQGKTGNVAALELVAKATGMTAADLGATTFRPPYLPISFGAVAGMAAKELFQPVRRMPAWHWHRNNGADFEPVELWQRPICYGLGDVSRNEATHREVRAVRTGVGIADASTLGKIEVRGPDAARFVERIYCGAMASLETGRCRYGLMLDEQGFVIDDGVTARLAEDQFLLHTSSAGARRIAGWLERWHQVEWPDLRLFITPVTEQWAQFVLAGPQARDVLQGLDSNISFSRGAFPFLAWRGGALAGVGVRIFRVSYTGELSYEIAAPANRAVELWHALLGAGAEHGITPFGSEALHVLRAEKGLIAIGQETDGTVTPFDLGLGGLVAGNKEDFIGKLGLARTALSRSDRRQLVGLLTEDGARMLPGGAYLIDAAARDSTPPHRMIGHVTSSYMSPTLGRPIALALVERGRERHGQTVCCPAGRDVIAAEIVEPVFYDRERVRMNG